jgi:hypothetical protein
MIIDFNSLPMRTCVRDILNDFIEKAGAYFSTDNFGTGAQKH